MELQISHSVGNSILNNTNPVIYRKGKIMYHLNLPYREMCNSDHYSIRTEVQEESVLQRKETRGRENTENTLRMEKDKNCGSRSMSRSCTYAGRNTAESSDIKLYGISEREKQPDDLRKVSGAEIQISESGILVQRILRGHSREKCKKDTRIYSKPIRRRQSRGTADDGKLLKDSFTSSK